MNILSLIDENIAITLDYYNFSKLLYDELLSYIKLYKTYTNQYCEKMKALQSDFDKKILKYKNESNKKINNHHILQFIKIIPKLIKKQILNYFPILDKIDIFEEKYNKFMNQQILLIKNQQEKYNESRKNFIKKCQEVDHIKTAYFNNLNQTEDTIKEYFILKKDIEEKKEKLNDNINKQININLELYKKLEEKANSLIRETKAIEINYTSSVESLKNLQNNIKELSNQTIQTFKNSLFEMTKIYIEHLIEILGLLKASFQVPLSLIDLNMKKVEKSKVKEIQDELLNNLYNKNISTLNIFPTKYKLKVFNLININKENIFSISSFNEDFNEKLDDNKEDLSEINLSLIKIMYKHFNLLSNHKIDIKLEEEKLYTNKLSTKFFLNVSAYNTNKIITFTKDKLFNEIDINKLNNLINSKPNRLVFLKKLNKFRTLSRFKLSMDYFLIIGNLLNKILSYFESEKDTDYNIIKSCIILSQTYFYLHENKKIYLKSYIEEHSIFKDPKLWEDLINFMIKKEMDNKIINLKNGHSSLVFGVIYTFTDTMLEFGLNLENINKIIEPKIEKYNLINSHKEEINNLLQKKTENNNKLLFKGKKISNELKEIIDKFENDMKNNKSSNDKDKIIISNKKEEPIELEKDKMNNN